MGFLQIFKKNTTYPEEMHELLKASFVNVRQDTDLIFQWINFLNQKIHQQELEISNLRVELSKHPKTKEAILEIIDSRYQTDGISDKLKNIDQRIDTLYMLNQQMSSNIPSEEIASLVKRINAIEQKRQFLKHRIIENVSEKSREGIKSLILSLIKKYKKISAQQRTEDKFEKKFKANEDSVGVIKERKQKHYMSQVSMTF